MYIRRIDDHEVRCLLDEDDLEEYGITLNEIMMGNEKARHLIEDIIIKAENEYGFVAGSTPLSVEIRPVEQDKLAMIITSSKAEENSDRQELISSLENIFRTFSKTVQELRNAVGNAGQNAQEAKEGIPVGEKPRILLKFSDYDAMCQFLKRRSLPVNLYKVEGDIYYMDSNFYIWIAAEEEDEIWKRTLTDYGEELAYAERFREVLEEHGKKIGSAQKLLESISDAEE